MAFDTVINEPGDCDHSVYESATIFRCGKERAAWVIWDTGYPYPTKRQICTEHIDEMSSSDGAVLMHQYERPDDYNPLGTPRK